MTNDREYDLIVLQVPVGTKSEWVRQSQSEGKKLNQWIFDRMTAERQASAEPKESGK